RAVLGEEPFDEAEGDGVVFTCGFFVANGEAGEIDAEGGDVNRFVGGCVARGFAGEHVGGGGDEAGFGQHLTQGKLSAGIGAVVEDDILAPGGGDHGDVDA